MRNFSLHQIRSASYIIHLITIAVTAVILAVMPLQASALSMTTHAAPLSEKGELLLEECLQSADRRAYDSMMRTGERLRDHGISIDHPVEEALGEAFRLNGSIHVHDTTDFSRSSQHLAIMLNTIEENQDWRSAAIIANALSKYHHYVRSDYSSASSYAFKSLKFAKLAGNVSDEVQALSLLAAVYFYKNDKSGGKYAEEAYSLAKKHGLKPAIYYTACNLSMLNFLNGQFEESLRFLQEARNTAESLNYDNERCYIYSCFGEIYSAMGDFAKAEQYFRKSIEDNIHTSMHDKIYARINYARFLLNNGRTADALGILSEADSLAKQNNILNFQLEIYQLMTNIYESASNWQMALKYQRLHADVDREINSREREREFAILDLRHQLTESELKVSEQKLQLARHTRTLITVSAIALLLGLTAIFLYAFHRRKMSLNKAIVSHHLENLEAERKLRRRLEETAISRSSQKGYTGPSDSKRNEIFNELERLMTEDKVYRQADLSLDRLAGMLGTNRSYLSQVINENFGHSLSVYVNSFRLKEAIELLSDPDNNDPLKNIGLSVGFQSPSNFYTLFRQKVGMSPSMYREQVKDLRDKSLSQR